MLSVDTNILLPSVDVDHRDHASAAAFVQSLQDRDDVAISEFILLELYVLLRNPAVVVSTLNAAAAARVCEIFRAHPRWQLIGFPADSRKLHDQLWRRLHEKNFARRRAYDLRSALCLLQSGVSEFATVNLKDFQGIGFARVWNPLSP
jgi:predicted nucleic acid-binding protein